MPRFTQADEAFLKRTMLPRAPACFFSAEDVELCMKQTGKEKAVIKNWEKCLRFRISHLSPAEIEKYLKASVESLDGKVMLSTCIPPIHTVKTFYCKSTSKIVTEFQ